MKRRLLALAVHLYPRAWRDRYGVEFAATLEDMPAPGWAALWNVIQGGLAMQIHRHGRTVATAAVLGALLAWAGSFAIRDVYSSRAALNGKVSPGAILPATERVLASPRFRALVNKFGLPGPQLEKHVSVSRVIPRRHGDVAFSVGFLATDPAVARAVTRELTQAIIDESGGQLSVLDSASLPEMPLYPNRKVIAFIGLLAGTLLGGLWVLLRSKPAQP